MDPARFYGSSEHVNTIPCDGSAMTNSSKSDLSLKESVPKEEFFVVDEQIIPTKCRNQLKQYNPAKPHKWGYKNQVPSGASGFSYDFDIFAGEQSNTFPDGAPDLGFNNPNLQIYLAKNGLLPLGTVRLNRVPNSEMPTAKDLKKQVRGFIVEKVAVIDNIKIGITTWFDNKPVNMLSTYLGSEPQTTKRR
ncbi:hypothetical protein JTB14_016755 [Gonioctena quinquepunctata]|nr:hypothetical protein JTB14_016755 [Gonioctena quinquepunctata]